MAEKIRKHLAAMILAVILGLLICGPYWYYGRQLGSAFQGIYPQFADDSLFYLARIKDVSDGHATLSNAYLWEHKNGPPQQLFLAEWLLAQPLNWFRLGISKGQLIYNFILPTVIFLLTYGALWLVFRSRSWSLFLSSGLLFELFFFSLFRPISPQFNFIFWLTQFIFLWLLVSREPSIRSRWLIWANILNFGLLFYIYPYYWTFYLILLCLLLIYYFFTERQLAVALFKIIIGGLILASYYFYYSAQASKLAYFDETLTRLQLVYSRFPSGINILAWSGGLLILFWLAWRLNLLKINRTTGFFAGGALASIIAVNQHVVTNRNFEFSSHYYMLAVFFSVFGFAYLVANLPPAYRRGLLSVVCLLLVFGFSLNLKRYLTFYVSAPPRSSQKAAAVFRWLNQNTEPESVVYADEDLSMRLPVYTANNVFYARYANLFFLSDAEVLDRFLINNYFAKVDQAFVAANERSIFGVRYVDRYGHMVQGNKLRRRLGLQPKPEIMIPPEAINTVLVRAKTIQKVPLVDLIRPYRLDYFIFTKTSAAEAAFKRLNLASLAFNDENYDIYKLNHGATR